MDYDPPVAVYDACVLYPFHLRNLLVQCAVDRLVEARWTDEIHAEWIGSVCANDPTIPIEHLRAARDLMNAVLPNATVGDYARWIPSVVLPDEDDRHVVAAARAAGGSLLITWNLRDFPVAELSRHGLRPETPDAFLTGLYDRVPDLVVEATAKARRNLRRSQTTAEEFIGALERQKLSHFTELIRSRTAEL